MVQQIDRVTTNLQTYVKRQEAIKKQIIATQMNSKKFKEEQKNILAQTIGIILLSVILFLLFIFLLLPGALRLSTGLKSISVFQQEDTVPPRVPTYSAPTPATKESSIEITGYAEENSQVIAVLNSAEHATVDVSAEGGFSIKIQLIEGENRFALYSKDTAGNESALGREYTVLQDNVSPEIEWIAPEDNRVVTSLREKQIEVEGTVSEEAKVYLNDTIVFVDDEGSFSDQFNLNDGENTLLLKAVDKAGNQTEQTRKVIYRP